MTTGFAARQLATVSDIPATPPTIPTVSASRKFIGGRDIIRRGMSWPPGELQALNRYQKFSLSLYTGEYSYNRKWIAFVDNIEREIPYCLLKLNYFKLIADKVVSLAFSNELLIRTGSEETDRQLQKLCDRVGFEKSIKQALLYSEIFGDSVLRVYKDGINVIPPYWGIKNVSPYDIDEIESITLFEYLYDESYNAYAVRFEIHYPESIVEFAHALEAGSLGPRISVKYQGRVISERGNRYRYPELGGINTCLWCSLNRDVSVYGSSAFDQIRDLVFTLESLTSQQTYIISDNTQPFLVMGMSMFTSNEETGQYELKKIRDKYLIKDSDGDPTYLEWGGDNIQHAANLSEDIMQSIYELSEISKSVISGEYSGQVTNETLQTTAKSAIDRAQRDVSDLWYQFRDALFVLAKLNGIDVNQDDLILTFNIDRSLSDTEIAEVVSTITGSKILSRKTILKKYFGFTDDQCDEELRMIQEDSKSFSQPESYSE